MLTSDQHLPEEVVGDAADELHLVGRHGQLEVGGLRGGRPPADETFRIAEGGVPLLRVVHRLMIDHLDITLLILRRQQREDGRRLGDAAPDPALAGARAPVRTVGAVRRARRVAREGIAGVIAVPVRRGGLGVDLRPAVRLRLGQQRLVVLLGGLVRIGADDLLAREGVGAGVAPGSGGGRVGTDPPLLPHRLDHLARGVAAVVARVGPVLAVLVEVLAGEQVDGQRLHSRGRPLDLRGLTAHAAKTEAAGREGVRVGIGKAERPAKGAEDAGRAGAGRRRRGARLGGGAGGTGRRRSRRRALRRGRRRLRRPTGGYGAGGQQGNQRRSHRALRSFSHCGGPPRSRRSRVRGVNFEQGCRRAGARRPGSASSARILDSLPPV